MILENDANAAALGEQWIGAGRGVSDLVLLTLGTGIGGGIICDGKMVRGFMGMAMQANWGIITVVAKWTAVRLWQPGLPEKHASASA